LTDKLKYVIINTIKNKGDNKMIVNKEKLEKLISRATIYCEKCPVYESEDWTICQKDDKNICLKSCTETLFDWLQEMDIAEALEEGAHIVNDQVVFPPVALPDDFTLNVPCYSLGGCVSSCPWYDKCPFEDD
jgi:hypothetical protein